MRSLRAQRKAAKEYFRTCQKNAQLWPWLAVKSPFWGSAPAGTADPCTKINKFIKGSEADEEQENEGGTKEGPRKPKRAGGLHLLSSLKQVEIMFFLLAWIFVLLF